MLFVLPIILVDYSQEVSLLFQFGVPLFQFKCHFHSEKTIVIIALQKVKYNPL